MSARFLPWGPEPLAPCVRAACRLLGVSPHDLDGPLLDLGPGAAARTAGIPGACAREHGDPAAADAPPAALAVAWPGPGDRPPGQRAAWWAALARTLRPGGVAAVRLDLLPGWHPLTALQDFARFHAGRQGLPPGAGLDSVLALAQELLGEEEGRWNGWLAWAARVRRDDPWSVPDLVGPPLYPATLRAWVEEARHAGLSWLGDVRGANGVSWPLGRALDAWVQAEVADRDDPLHGEQIADFARNQHVRLALFRNGPPPAPRPLEAVRALALAPALSRPTWWALEPPPDVDRALDATAEAPLARRILDAVAAAPTPLPPAALSALADEAHLARATITLWQLDRICLQDGPGPVSVAPPEGFLRAPSGALIPAPPRVPEARAQDD